ncbi:hypothetical protein [Methylophilus sp. TWE2]|uniref:hypothetical protein n=1 Tax=Methylophilus sp. TWE2 TaxID=1662285 RepID=UPI00067163A5|nr:hypothetical protein [Methylophilus sp. TWE2]AKR44003.1 hypothetical protein ACJ67_11725 [Methylophilus sp. TWE2]
MTDLEIVRKKVANLKALKTAFQCFRDTSTSALARKFNGLVNEVTLYIYRAKLLDSMDELQGDSDNQINEFIRDVEAFEQRTIELLGLDAKFGGK